MPKNKKPDYEKEKAKWYKKLENSGFVDIEQDEDNLKKWSSVFTAEVGKHSLELWKIKAEYFQMATNFLEEYKFDNNVEKVIWEYHANGLSIREIADLLKKARVKSVGVKKSNVSLIIKRLKNSMYAMYVAPTEEYHE
jgi:transposase-like protein